jgi:signal transduction histidine kinase
MTQLSGEIAHELKNPLASVKGLAALLERRSEGANVEPFLVMRRELDRMQATLEEFLNFSRPLVPLNLALASLDALVRDVCALHEGMSESKRVSIIVARSETVTVLCDARKVRQILINLVQNAIEASAPGTTIVLNVLRTDEAARVVVEDEGTGVDSFVGARAFDAGVTSKTGGSGLGLNVARGLARQHGGDVTLENRSPRGCRATLTLPLTDTRSSTTCATTDGTPAVTSEGK